MRHGAPGDHRVRNSKKGMWEGQNNFQKCGFGGYIYNMYICIDRHVLLIIHSLEREHELILVFLFCFYLCYIRFCLNFVVSLCITNRVLNLNTKGFTH